MQGGALIKSATVSRNVQRLTAGLTKFVTSVAAPTKNTSMMTSLVANKTNFLKSINYG